MQTLKRFVLVGAPASGKGTQARFLSETYQLESLSTGALLRHEIAEDTELGRRASSFMERAMLVPDDIVNGIVRSWIENHREACWLLDGYPRTVAQAETLETNLEAAGLGLDVVVWLDVARELIEARMLRRRECPACGHITRNGEETCPVCRAPMQKRSDDNAAAFALRWRDYEILTEPVVRYFQQNGLVVHVRVTEEGEPEEVSRRIAAALREYAEKH